MPRRSLVHYMVEASRDEALNAVEFYNRPGGKNSLEAFLVHMHIAWLYLLHAEFKQSGISYYFRDPKHPTRYQRVDGEKKAWDLTKCVRERWPDDSDPVRRNLEVTIRLRNRIEHRYEHGLMVSATGFLQALLMNYEEELVAHFGSEYSIADMVHIPISLSTFSREGLARLIAAQNGLPIRLKEFVASFRAEGVSEELLDDKRYELRIDIVPKRSSRSDADLAVTFVYEDQLTADEKKAYQELEKTGRVILRDKARPVVNLDRFRPSEVSEKVEEAIPYRFSVYSEFPRAWKALRVRPPSNATGAAVKRTKADYCLYDNAHNDYVYTRKYVDLLISKCSSESGFINLIGRAPRLKEE